MSDTTPPILPAWAQTRDCSRCGQPLWPWQSVSSGGEEWHLPSCEQANQNGPRNIVAQVCVLLQANVYACEIIGRAVSEIPDESWNDDVGQPLFAAKHALDDARDLWAALRTGAFVNGERPVPVSGGDEGNTP